MKLYYALAVRAPHHVLPFAITLGIMSTTLHAENYPAHYLSVVAENDIYAPRGQDRHYTNGIRIGYGLHQDQQSNWFTWLGKYSPLFEETESQKYELALGQNIYTPENFIVKRPLLQDRPYAGWIYGELSVSTHRAGTTDDLTLNLGMVGPVALAEPAQKLIHDLVGDPKPGGWSNQLSNEPTVLVRYRRSWFLPLLQLGTLKSDLVPGVGFNLGNAFTDAGFGTTFRIGNHLPEQNLPVRIQPGLSGGNSLIPVRHQQFDWVVYAQIQGRAVIHNIFLDGNTFADSQSVDKRTFVHDLATGFIFGFGQSRLPVTFSFNVVWRGREFDLQKGNNSFGSLMIGVQY